MTCSITLTGANLEMGTQGEAVRHEQVNFQNYSLFQAEKPFESIYMKIKRLFSIQFYNFIWQS